MSASQLASQILTDMWEYGRLVLIVVAVAAVSGFIIDHKNDHEGSNATGGMVLIGLCTVGAFTLFSFLNVQGANILALMRDSPAWGTFTSAAVTSLVVVSGITAYRYLAANRSENTITITGTSEQMPRKTITGAIKLSWLIVLLLLFASTIWLWRLAGG
jgi:hypothetical protein